MVLQCILDGFYHISFRKNRIDKSRFFDDFLPNVFFCPVQTVNVKMRDVARNNSEIGRSIFADMGENFICSIFIVIFIAILV